MSKCCFFTFGLVFARFDLIQGRIMSKVPLIDVIEFWNETLYRYVDHGESKNSTSGPNGSDLKGNFKVKYRHYTKKSAF